MAATKKFLSELLALMNAQEYDAVVECLTEATVSKRTVGGALKCRNCGRDVIIVKHVSKDPVFEGKTTHMAVHKGEEPADDVVETGLCSSYRGWMRRELENKCRGEASSAPRAKKEKIPKEKKSGVKAPSEPVAPNEVIAAEEPPEPVELGEEDEPIVFDNGDGERPSVDISGLGHDRYVVAGEILRALSELNYTKDQIAVVKAEITTGVNSFEDLLEASAPHVELTEDGVILN